MVCRKYGLKMDYRDLTIGIPVRIDSLDRIRNLNTVIRFLKKFENIKIIVIEADTQSSVKDIAGVTKIFIEDYNPLFHKNRYIRKLFDHTTTKFVGIWDSDVIVSRRMVDEAIDQLRTDKADMSIPYNGIVYFVNNPALEDFLINSDVDLLLENQKEFSAYFGHHSCGGAFIVNKEKHFAAGGENERFTSWGPEDFERYKRWEICGMRVHRGSEPMFHLPHQRGLNSWYVDQETRKRLYLELIKTCRSTKEELCTVQDQPDSEPDIYGVILMLHRVVEKRSLLAVNRELEITPDFLEQTILKYKSEGYRFASLDEVQQQVESQQHDRHKFVCFTFDDGYADNYELAYPIFKKHNCPFAIYVATDFPDKKALLWWYHLQDVLFENERLELNGVAYDCSDTEKKNQAFKAIRHRLFTSEAETIMHALKQLFKENSCSMHQDVNKLALSWEQIIEMSADPLCTIAAHTVSHPSLPTLSNEAIRKELLEGKQKIEDKIKKPVKHFAYPFGNQDNRVESLALEQFSTAVLAWGGTVQKGDTLYRLKGSSLFEKD